MNIPAGLVQRFGEMAANIAAQSAYGGTGARTGILSGGVGGMGGPGGVGSAAGLGETPSFGATLKRALDEVSFAQDNARSHVDAFLRGEPVELHQVMAATEEAGIAVEMLIEIRNKFTEAYRTVINMQS